jgi:hypothetical protein
MRVGVGDVVWWTETADERGRPVRQKHILRRTFAWWPRRGFDGRWYWLESVAVLHVRRFGHAVPTNIEIETARVIGAWWPSVEKAPQETWTIVLRW